MSGGRRCATARWPGTSASAEIERLRGQLRGVDNDPAGAARVARDGAGVLAAWSLALEGDAPGPLARAARQLARSAEHPAHRRTPPPRARPRSSALALFLLAGARPDSTAGWFLLARQLSLLGRDWRAAPAPRRA